MKALRTLMRLARAEADALRGLLSDAEAAHVKSMARIALLEAGIVDEQAVARRHAPAWSYGAYAGARAEDRRTLTAEEAACAHDAEALRAELAAAYREFKKFERLVEWDAARAAEAERAREQAEMDEAATLRAGRRGRER
jgi:flagellar export protein FliJ